MDRDKKAKFREIGKRRVENALKSIRVIGKLSNKNNYDYTPDDVGKLIRALNKEVTLLKAKFESGGKEEDPTFDFD